MAVGPDVHQAHQEDTERYVLTNLNIVSPSWGCWPSWGTGGPHEPLGTVPRLNSWTECRFRPASWGPGAGRGLASVFFLFLPPPLRQQRWGSLRTPLSPEDSLLLLGPWPGLPRVCSSQGPSS